MHTIIFGVLTRTDDDHHHTSQYPLCGSVNNMSYYIKVPVHDRPPLSRTPSMRVCPALACAHQCSRRFSAAYTVRPCMRVHVPAATRTSYRGSSARACTIRARVRLHVRISRRVPVHAYTVRACMHVRAPSERACASCRAYVSRIYVHNDVRISPCLCRHWHVYACFRFCDAEH